MIKTKEYVEFESIKWACKKPIPSVGSTVNVKINGIGKSTVLKYFHEHGFLGMIVQPEDPPVWYIKQNGADEPCHVFPSECEELQARKEDGEVDKEFYQAIHSS